MAIKLIDVYNNLKDCSKTLYSRQNGEEFLVDSELLSNEISILRKNILYVCEASVLNEMNTENIPKCNLLILKDEEYDLEKLINRKISIIECDSNTEFQELFDSIKDMFLKDYMLLDSSAILLDALIKEKGLKYIVNISSEIFENPVILIDSGFKVLAHSDVEEITEPFWLNNINMGYCSYEFISAVKKIKSFQSSPNTNEPFIVICPESPIRKLVSKVIIDGNSVGSVIILESNEKFTDNTYEVIKLLSNVISEELKKDQVYRNLNGLMYENLIVDVLEKSVADEKTLKERMKSANCNFGDNLYLLVAEISSYNTTNAPSNYLKQSLEQIFAEHKSLFYKDHILILVDLKKDSSISPDTKKRLVDFLEKHDITLAVSSNFHNILDIGNSYKQCKDTLELVSKLNLNGNVFFYEDFKFYHLLCNTNPNINLLNFCSDGLLKLIDYDKENNTEYFKTLKAYIAADKNAVQTAKNMYIHRNTINYRLNKIKEISNLDLDNGDEIFRLTMSMKILEFSEQH